MPDANLLSNLGLLTPHPGSFIVTQSRAKLEIQTCVQLVEVRMHGDALLRIFSASDDETHQ